MSTREQTVGTEALPALPGWARSRPFFRRRDRLEGQAANEPSWIKSPESSPVIRRHLPEAAGLKLIYACSG